MRWEPAQRQEILALLVHIEHGIQFIWLDGANFKAENRAALFSSIEKIT